MLLRTLRLPLLLTAIALVLTLIFGGPAALFVVAVLAILEISLSFDNAVVNAKVVARMSPFWQWLFLTVGIAIAVFGMRLVFPLVIVSLAGGLGPVEVVQLALHHPDEYAQALHQAHAGIAAFGGMFLLMLFLDFVFTKRPILWLKRLETVLAMIGRLPYAAVILALITLISITLAWSGDQMATVLLAGVSGVATYLTISGLSRLFETQTEDHLGGRTAKAAGLAGFFSFIYLELLDASFSFDGVLGAFAITNQILLIALGLGIGAIYIRSLTVYLVKRGTLAEYVYLEHGAHYAIGALGLLMLATLRYDIPQAVTGLLGVAFILVAFFDSRDYRKRHGTTPLN